MQSMAPVQDRRRKVGKEVRELFH